MKFLFLALTITKLLSHSRSFKVIRNYTDELSIGGLSVSILYRYWYIQRRILAWPWNVSYGVVQGHRKWYYSGAWVRFPVRIT